MNNYLKLLKFASAFTDYKNCDFRQFTKIVNVKQKNAQIIIEATQGHIATRVVIDEKGLNPSVENINQYTVDSIIKSNKVNSEVLLEEFQDFIKFPDIDKVMDNHKEGSNYAQFDVYLLQNVLKALAELSKAFKIKLPRLDIVNLASESATKLNFRVNDDITIDIAIMPLRP